MEKGRIYVYAADTAVLEEEALFAAGYDMVSGSRREKIDRKRLPGDKRLSLAAELLLMGCLREWGIVSYQFGYGINGKPYLRKCGYKEGYGQGDIPLHFNLSHSKERVMCAIADQKVGCDTEKIRSIDLSVARRFFAPEEYEKIAALKTGEEQIELFFRYWTRKESFLKATGRGCTLPLDSFRADGSKDSLGYHFKEYDLQDGYKYAVCGLGELFEEKIRIMDLRDVLRKMKDETDRIKTSDKI